ncbi:WDR75 [Bugula neritina]|uniref:WDR75 n=1 Tax=Bugula neritina TaxID=10212 RepID=A0A7J7KTI3_BUGNE|nr:WDR75 [Bugula neritina]
MDDALTIRLADTESITSYSPIVSKDKRFLLCCSGCDVKVYSIRSGQCVHVLRGHQDLVTSFLFNPANQFQVLSSSLDGTIKRWNFEDGVLINTTTPRCLDSSTPLAVYGMYDLPNDKKHFIYLIKTSGGDNSEEKGGYRFLKQTVQMETWSTADFISTRTMKKLPSHVSIGGKIMSGLFLAAIISTNEFDVFNLLKGGNSLRHRVSNDSNVVEVMQCLAKPTCLAAHPSEDCVAVGHADGKINIWSNVLSKKAKHSWVAWHALPVLSLKFTPEGATC